MIDEFGVYRHSGRLGSAPVVMPVAGLFAALVLGGAYSLVIVYLPFVGKVTILLAFGMAIGVGLLISHVAWGTHCRSTVFAYLVGLATGLVTVYAAWVAFAWAILWRSAQEGYSVSYTGFLMHPSAVWRFAQVINKDGWYSIRGSTPTGSTLWAMWIVEAVIILCGITALSASQIKNGVFCERCRKWCREVHEMMRIAVPEDHQLLERMISGDVDGFKGATTLPSSVRPYMLVEACHCDACDEVSTYNLALVTSRVVDANGKLEDEKRLLTRHRLIGANAYTFLCDLAQKPTSNLEDLANAVAPAKAPGVN
jgi:hypothetical protein